MPDPSTWIGALPDFDVVPLADQRIVCAAQRHRISGMIVTGARHFDRTMCNQIDAMLNGKTSMEAGWFSSESGFIDQFGTFLTRKEAWIVAKRQGQIRDRCGGDDDGTLFSENLY
jgi:hypothetical protein